MNTTNELIEWSLKNFSYLPWRKERTIYRTLISEIMLQQTTVATVLNKFENFIKKFPNLIALAAASEEELQIAWKGLGYYRRASNLKKAANYIVNNWSGIIPDQFERLISVPGIGRYTANAICSIGYGQPLIAVDANLERVLARFYGLNAKNPQELKELIYTKFSEGKILNSLDKSCAREINEALMDLGRTICRSQKTECQSCPLKKECHALKTKNFSFLTDSIKNSEKEKLELHLLRIAITKNKKLLVYKKESSEWLNGQWEMPTLILKTSDSKLKQYPKIKNDITTKNKNLKVFKTSITKYKIYNHILELTEKEFNSDFKKYFKDRDLNFLEFSDSDSVQNFSTATLKALKLKNQEKV